MNHMGEIKVEVNIAYSFKNLRNGWARVTSGVMHFGRIPGKYQLSMKVERVSPSVILYQNFTEGDIQLDCPFMLKTGQYFRWKRLK